VLWYYQLCSGVTDVTTMASVKAASVFYERQAKTAVDSLHNAIINCCATLRIRKQ
jgi:hypothetical protein